ncbi:ATP-binding protein [Streptosporangium sp. NBC_01639]|uniref:ATP-binding protein n=1 Tax=Streptosporangium sp. NBC_01639 TaxID=2975948 RepID=UPI003869C290|nr:ATP-binding protein [Streptosporangium sp. NBC_01639]
MVSSAQTPLGKVLPRRAEKAVEEALSDTRVTLVTGARQCGKSTLVRLLAKGRAGEWRNLDTPAARQAAIADPAGFVAFPELMVIDEIQRAPDLLLAIKEQVDSDPRPGRYLLTGSARILGLRVLPDALPGRMETIELWPFSQGEIDGAADGFMDAIFAEGENLHHTSAVSRVEYAERIVRGGFPEAVARTNVRRRERFLDSYVADLIARDVSQLAEIERTAEMRALIRLLAARSGQLLVAASLGNEIGLSASTVHRYLSLLEEVFLIKRIPAWSRNLSSRAVGTPKVAFVDSGIAANLLGADSRSLLRPDGAFGPLLEGFVLMELARQLTWSDERVELFHYRTKDKVEVDVVLENRQGRVVGIEVKASSTVRPDDFRGLRHLADRLGDDFAVGVVLYTGTQTLPFGERMRAMPVSALWEVAAPR